jgi:drug/metabolite transporter (DMT)-like permease
VNWFFIALIAPFLYALANHTDKYLITKYLKNGEAGAFIIFSALFSVVALPIVALIHPGVMNVTLATAVGQAINGMLVVVSILCYFYALDKDEASFVVPLYQTMPIFGFILGYFILGESIRTTQILASLVILAGATILSIDFTGKFRLKKEVIGYMLLASLMYAISTVMFKFIAVGEENFWPSLFWNLVGKALLGIIFFAFIRSYRRQFVTMIKSNAISAIALTSLSETLFILAEAISAFATFLAPVFLVLLVDAFQPVFVLILGILLTVFFPKISQESLTRKSLIQKFVGVGIIVLGTYFVAA